MHVSDIGRSFSALYLSPFLNAGATFACFQSLGMVPECIQELNANNNKNIQTDLIIMDFAKAFDKVSHRRLLYKRKYYGIQTHTLNWIQAFLTDRTQTVVIDGITSNTVPVTSGVPQGTVLGSILFLQVCLYIFVIVGI
jgi:hypothetical protein